MSTTPSPQPSPPPSDEDEIRVNVREIEEFLKAVAEARDEFFEHHPEVEGDRAFVSALAQGVAAQVPDLRLHYAVLPPAPPPLMQTPLHSLGKRWEASRLNKWAWSLAVLLLAGWAVLAVWRHHILGALFFTVLTIEFSVVAWCRWKAWARSRKLNR